MPDAVAIVTGAGSGIGRAVVARLIDARYKVVLVGRRREPLEETRHALGVDAVDDVIVMPADVSIVEEAGAIVDRARTVFGRVDALINNAAILEVQPLVESDRAALDRTLAVNVAGPFELVRLVLPIMSDQGGGVIVNVSSVATIDPFPGLATYAASKAAVESLTRSIAVETGDAVRAYAVAPGAVETAMLRSVVTADQLPTESALAPDDVAQVIVDCVQGTRPEATGSTIVVPSP